MAFSSYVRTLRYLWSSLTLKIRIFIDKSIQLAGPFYIFLAVTLISCIIYLFFTTILPSIHSVNSFKGISHVIISIWLIFNVFFNYIYCIKTDPGSPSDFTDVEHDSISSSNGQEASGVAMRWCKNCQKAKPPMTHHCHICKRCILKMDHHCPWMHNCIGFFNYRFFFLFLFYLWIGCAYTTYMASIPLQATDEDEDITQILFTFVLAIAVFFALTGLFWFHVYLVLSAQVYIKFRFSFAFFNQHIYQDLLKS
ncbi:hypothetical protein GOP47_0012116 [Adiantum capillus-veneris]|uniref:S-acyltransferase n=1 Tax=Adiantum capillus-veneris TaxID=13818 RepID=A0A9D4ZG77_ADICA|nr:hypothetical protein GOP47_0012116 [Adiantum capillus-veneris]